MSKRRTASVTDPRQLLLPLHNGATNTIRAGLLARKDAVREALTVAMTGCPLSRDEIAQELSRLTGEQISATHLNNWSSEAKREWRFPAEYAAAFCRITNDSGVLGAILDGSGYGLADEKTIVAARYGRLLAEKKKRAQQERELLEAMDV